MNSVASSLIELPMKYNTRGSKIRHKSITVLTKLCNSLFHLILPTYLIQLPQDNSTMPIIFFCVYIKTYVDIILFNLIDYDNLPAFNVSLVYSP